MWGRRGVTVLVALALAVGGCVWEKPIWSFPSGEDSRAAVSWSGDGRFLLYGDYLSAADDIHFRLRDMTTGVDVEDFGVGAFGVYGGTWAMSGDGRYIAYAAQDGEQGDGSPIFNVYLHDRQTSTDTLVSETVTGEPGDRISIFADISEDGSQVVFQSDAVALVPETVGHTTQPDQIYRYTVATGALDLITQTASGEPGNANSTWPVVSADGSHVAFESRASNLVPGDTNGASDVFVSSPGVGITRRSVALGGANANGGSHAVKISADGSTVSFVSQASNLVPGGTTSWDIYAAGDAGQVEQVNLRADGSPVSGTHQWGLRNYGINHDGSLVLFGAEFPDGTIRIRDRTTQSTQTVVADVGGVDDPYHAMLTDDGRTVLVTIRTEIGPGSFVDEGFLRHSQEPVINAITPSSVGPGTALVTIEGEGFHPGTTMKAASGSGVTFSNVTIVDRGTITATVSVAPGAAVGQTKVTANVPRDPLFGSGFGGIGNCTCLTVIS